MKTKKPNVLILYSDQHSARCLGCYGNNEVKTPHLDALAKDGLRFTRAYTQNPICTPSRLSFLSGQYPHNFGYYGLMGQKPAHLPSMFSSYKKAGYRCGLSGKTHTPSEWLRPFCDKFYDGFGYEQVKDASMYEHMEGVQGIDRSDYNNYLKEKGLLDQRDDKIYHEWYAVHQHGAGQGLDARPSRLSEDDTIEAWSAQCAIDFIKDSVQEDKPFFFWMTVPRPHQTYVPAQKFWDMYETDKLSLPDNANDTMEGRHTSAQKQQQYFKNDKSWISFEPKDYESARRRVLHGYYANVSQVDDACGRVLSALEHLGLREDTLVLYLTDHGEFAGEHGMIEKAPGIAFHCVTHIPSLLSWPGHLPSGETRTSLIESVDWFPTLLNLCGLEPMEHCDGYEISQVLLEDSPVRDFAFTENAFTKTIHSKQYKMTVYIEESCKGKRFGELYDLEEDPGELQNLFFDEAYQSVVNELHYALLQWLLKTSRPRTIGPSVCNAAGQDGDWDLGEEFLAEDGSVKNSYIRGMIERESFNYF